MACFARTGAPPFAKSWIRPCNRCTVKVSYSSVVRQIRAILSSAIMPAYVGQNKGIITNSSAAIVETLTNAPSMGNA